MLNLAAALLVLAVPQDENRLKESWPKLAEAWRAVEAYKPSPEGGVLDDEFLKAAARLHDAFDAAGLFATDGEYLPLAVKALIKAKARSIFPTFSNNPFAQQFAVVRKMRPGGVVEWSSSNEGEPLAALVASLKKLQSLKQSGLDDEDNVQDELATVRKSMKALGITADDTPPALRRRALHLVKALALGEEFPAPAAATEEQAKRFRGWFADLANESIEIRETAMKELLKAGEASLPFAREALKNPDAEVVSRAKTLLGYAHAPWTRVKPQEAEWWGVQRAAPALGVAPAAPPPPAPPKEAK